MDPSKFEDFEDFEDFADQAGLNNNEDDEETTKFIGRKGVLLPSSGHTEITRSAHMIFSRLAKTQKIFLYGGAVCEMIEDKETGSPTMDPIVCDAFRSRLEEHCRLFMWRSAPHGKKRLQARAVCNTTQAAALLNATAKNLLPHVAGIHGCPLMIESNGAIKILGKGYHEEAGGRIILGEEMPENMSINEAVDTLLMTLEEFDFQTPADKSRAIAAMLSPNLKFLGAISKHDQFPVFLAEADKSQSGKGYIFDLIYAIYAESPSFVTQAKGGVGSLDERISAALIKARQFILFDNFRGPIESAFFESLLTNSGTVPARTPYKPEILVTPSRFIYHITSNGLITTEDLSNRLCVIRIKKRPGFLFRDYREGKLIEHIQENQSRFLGAIYCINSQWIAHGKKTNSTDPRGEGRFRKWWQILDHIVQHFFGLPSPLEGHEEIQTRVATPEFNWLREIFLRIKEDGQLDTPLRATEIAELCQLNNIQVPGTDRDANDTKLSLTVGIIMAKLFKKSDRITYEGFTVQRTEEPHFFESSGQEKSLKKYAFWI